MSQELSFPACLTQLERTCLAVVEVVRPGGTAHATLAAMHAVDSGACRQALLFCDTGAGRLLRARVVRHSGIHIRL